MKKIKRTRLSIPNFPTKESGGYVLAGIVMPSQSVAGREIGDVLFVAEGGSQNKKRGRKI